MPRISLTAYLSAAVLTIGGIPLLLFIGLTLRAASQAEAVPAQAAAQEHQQLAAQSAALDRTVPLFRQALEDASLVAYQLSMLLLDPHVRTTSMRMPLARLLLGRSQPLAGVAVYRSDGTFVDAVYREGMRAAVIAPLPTRHQLALQEARQEQWLAANEARTDVEPNRRVLLYYVAPMFHRHRSQLRGVMVGVFTAASLDAALQTLASQALRSAPGTSDAPTGWGLVLAPLGSDELAAGTAHPGLLIRSLPEYRLRLAVQLSPRAHGAPIHAPWRVASGSFLLLLLLAVPYGYVLRRSERAPLRLPAEPMPSQQQPAVPPARTELALRSSEELVRSSINTAPISITTQRRDVSIVFFHLIGFRAFAETASPAATAALFQEVAEIMNGLVLRHQGIIDCVAQDSMVAIFGVSEPHTDTAQRALFAAEDILRFVQATSPRWQQAYSFTVCLAIGSTSGQAIVEEGSGLELRKFQVLGDALAIAAHLAGLAQAGQIVAASAGEKPGALELGAPGEPAGRDRETTTPITVMQLL